MLVITKKSTISEAFHHFTIEIKGEILEDQFGNSMRFKTKAEAEAYIEENELKNAKVVGQNFGEGCNSKKNEVEEKFIVKVDGEIKKNDDDEEFEFNSKEAAQAYIDKHEFKNAEIVKKGSKEKKEESVEEFIEIQEEFKLPGTNIILEKGDRIQILN